MKFIHTSDWHLGQQLYGYDRREEQEDMLLQIVELVRERQPDALLVSGDVYDSSQPSATVQRMFADAVVKMHKACPGMVIVVTSGNHDSGASIEAFQTPWLASNVHVVGKIEREHPERHIVEIPGKGLVAALPYGHERNLPTEFYGEVLNAAAQRNPDGLPVVMMAHTAVRGSDFEGHTRTGEDRTIGGIDAVDLEGMGTGYDYLALGHIHKPQRVHGGHGRVRYSGAPIAVSFDEAFPHSVNVVEIEAKGSEPVVEAVEIVQKRQLVTLPGKGEATEWEECIEILRNFPNELPAYIRLNVKVKDFLPPDAAATAETRMQEKDCRFCLINPIREEGGTETVKALTVQELQAMDPLSVLRKYIEDKGLSFREEYEAMFREAYERVKEDDRQ